MDKNHEVYKHKHICLVEDHSNPLGIVRSLGEEGIKPIVLLCDKHPKVVNKSKYIGELHCFDTIEEGLNYMIANFSNEEYKPFVYNGSDNITQLLDVNYDKLKEHFYFTQGAGSICTYMQKSNQNKLAVECGLSIPKEEVLQVGTMPTKLNYPVITKATTSANGGVWKDQTFICDTPQELSEAYKKLKVDTILVQEFIKKKNELCIDGISINGGEQVFMPYGCGYYRFVDKSYGLYMKFVPFRNPELISKIKSLIKAMKFTGIFCIEFLEDEKGDYYFLEVNLRNSGWSYAFTYGGYNLPIRWAKATLENEINLDDFTPLEEFDAMEEIADFKRSVIKLHQVSLFQWIKEFRKSCCYNYNKADMAPFWALLSLHIKQKMSNILKK